LQKGQTRFQLIKCYRLHLIFFHTSSDYVLDTPMLNSEHSASGTFIRIPELTVFKCMGRIQTILIVPEQSRPLGAYLSYSSCQAYNTYAKDPYILYTEPTE